MKLLIVDDSEIVREILVDSLGQLAGIEIVGEAGNAIEAVDKIQALRPDAIVLDFKMPGGNGLSVLRELKKANLSPLVVMVTNYPYPQYRDACLNAGAHYFLDKSSEFEKISEILLQAARPPRQE